MTFGRTSRVQEALDHPEARAVLERALPGLADHPSLDMIRGLPIRVLIDRLAATADDEAKAARLWEELAAIETPATPDVEAPAILPRSDYESDLVVEGSAATTFPRSASKWSTFEIRIAGPSHGNPFTDVELTALFDTDGHTTEVDGFYDGDGQWVLRFLPEATGRWSFRTTSTARSLHALTGEFEVSEALAGDHGPVRADGFHFAHADGTRHTPLGTTAYAWIHQPADVRAATLRTLASAPFTKLRMTVFPKGYLYNSNEPELFPFAGDSTGGFDHTRFNPAFFRHLEATIVELGQLGIEADVILFHPYDRWGFADLGRAADDRYVQYVVRRLSAIPNVWWSMANEYDLIAAKTESDWERLAAVVRANDPVRHLQSIHNGLTFYDQSREWITHASVQRTDTYRTAENVDEWRRTWGKPVVVDECGYEGNLEYSWGNISGQELTRRFWEGAVRGGYVGHGETYYRDDEQIWWAKGGLLTGESPARIQFLRRIIEEAPGGVLEPLARGDAPQAGIAGEFYLTYFGFNRPYFYDATLPAGKEYRVDVIDTWNMTIDPLPATYRDRVRVDLPSREYLAVRVVAVDRPAEPGTHAA
ncbi:DUF5605 domain-containing protein [Frankia sp. AgB1.9]|uniref:DUF5605 domain-containing protein n=1 Tax=unclassified Frankia TaxID=2632575 RepID=UPI001934439E|nr:MULTISPECIES: DUF5605 domain-containing protein [unclassified Frankia]MBL7493345.1 DUF5605 domain-containing protein [Frankia sp. AgW1.1]MBL7549577.1 DUF5605 domain-containing protein [Frankia sp. AgB1.9]MBL7620443.1 DUF5605 domain-containing protein [Frankia sp. AgB1.8]